MNLIERYLYQVEKYLPRSSRNEIIDELRSLILEQLDDQGINPDDDQRVAEVLKNFGEPRKVAASYTKQDDFISRELQPLFYFVVKIVAYTLPITLLFVSMIDYFSNNDTYNVIDFLLSIVYSVPGIIMAMFTSLGIIFIVFTMISRSMSSEDFDELKMPEFDPLKLPKVPTSIYKVSITESIISILFSILFLYILNYQQGIIAVYYEDVRYPLLNENFNQILLFINIGIFAQITIAIVHLYLRQKTFVTKTLEYLHTIYSAVVLFLLASTDIFNQTIIDGYDLSIVPRIFTILLIIGGVAALLGGTVEFLKMFIFIKRERV